MKRLFKLFLAFFIMLSGLSLPKGLLSVSAKEKLINVAPDAEIEVPSAYAGHPKENINDGNDETSWQADGSVWPTSVHLDLKETGTNVEKVVVKLGSGDVAGRTVDVTVKAAQNGITSDLKLLGERKGQELGTDVEFILDAPTAASDIYVELSNPTAPTGEVLYYPEIREIEVYETQEYEISEYGNIAAQAEVTTDGLNPINPEYLTDEKYDTLYKFHDAQLTEEKYVQLSFGENRAMDAFEITFEHVDNEQYNYLFTYSIVAKQLNDDNWETIVDHATANRTDNYFQEYQIDETVYSDIKIIMHDTTSTAGKGWPAIAEFKVFGAEIKTEDNESIAYNKPLHVSQGKNTASKINDGNLRTEWKSDYYPAYVDIDLEKNYYLDTVEVYTPTKGYSQYSIYTSMDGRDFEKLAEKTSTEIASEEGEIYKANSREARYIRVYMEYNSNSSQAVLREVRATGKESGTPLQEKTAIEVSDFKDSKYNVEVTAQDTYDEVNGIIERRLGKQYQNWFDLELMENPKGNEYDYFQLSDANGKIKIQGNNGVSLATGLNHYLKYFCNVHVSQVGDQVDMPASVVKVGEPVFKETKAKIRYSYNYCTLSYSMAFYGEKEWRDELDWLAMNGVNVVLDATGQEEVWRRFLTKIGYPEENIKDFIAGPAYYAWAYMANLSGFGGPVHDSWFSERTELARKNQLAMRKLGMQPVLQGYSGMVPVDIQDYDKDVEVIPQGTWCSFQRPYMLKTTSVSFDEYADLFYEAQKEVYGDISDYYATDPFHEGGNVGGMQPAEISENVLDSMMKADKDAVWIIQSWQGNPTSELLRGLDGNEEHALVLDLYAEKDPHYEDGNGGNSYGYEPEFDKTPWVFCMLNNFGGRLGLHGHLDNLANNIPKVFNETEYVAGIGITPEASVNNPLLYDFLFETVWVNDAEEKMEVINLDSWIEDYATRRYGAESESAQEALKILKETVYKSSLNMKGQGAPESVVNARPALDISAASTWGNAVIDYDKGLLEDAAKLLLKDYDELKNSEAYMYDLATVLQQVLSNSAQEYQKSMSMAFRNIDLEAFKEISSQFLELIDMMEKVTGSNEYYMLGRWVNMAKRLAANADDFSKDLYEFNAKALVTTWGSINQAETGGLKDYSNRQWSGLIKDYYKPRWERWIDNRVKELEGKAFEKNINWFEWEWNWARSNTEYSEDTNNADLKALGNQILTDFSVKDPNADSSNDINPNSMSVEAGNSQEGEGPERVLDNDVNTLWHTEWKGSSREDQWLEFTLNEEQLVNGMRMQTRSSNVNGVITEYNLYVQNSDSNEWISIIENGKFDDSLGWKKVMFEPIKAKKIRLEVVDALSSDGNLYASAAEIRFTHPEKIVDKTELENLITEAEKLQASDYTEESWNLLQTALTEAKTVLNKNEATQEEVNNAVNRLRQAIGDLEEKVEETIVQKDKLYEALTKYAGYESSDYTPESWKVFKSAYDQACEVYLDINVTQETVDRTLEKLLNAVSGLEKVILPSDPTDQNTENEDSDIEKTEKPDIIESEKTEKPDKIESPETGVQSNSSALVVLISLAGAVTFISRKRRVK